MLNVQPAHWSLVTCTVSMDGRRIPTRDVTSVDAAIHARYVYHGVCCNM